MRNDSLQGGVGKTPTVIGLSGRATSTAPTPADAERANVLALMNGRLMHLLDKASFVNANLADFMVRAGGPAFLSHAAITAPDRLEQGPPEGALALLERNLESAHGLIDEINAKVQALHQIA